MSEHILTKDNILIDSYRGRLTEGVTYNPSNDTLLWVDIINAEVHRVNLSRDLVETHEVLKFDDPAESIGAIGLTSDDNVIIICCKYGIAKGNFKTGALTYILEFNHNEEQRYRLRSNDGIIDPWGHLWIGVMTDFPVTRKEGGVKKPEGKLYRVDCHDLTIEEMISSSFISNGLNFSASGKKFYWTDSLTYKIWEFDYDYISNKLYNKKAFIDFKKLFPGVDSPEPDGLAIDKNDEIYSTVFHTGQLLHFNNKGEVVEVFKLPCLRPTCVTIGGKNNNELFITSAHEDVMDPSKTIDADNKSGDLGGFLFRIKLDRNLNGKIKFVWGGK